MEITTEHLKYFCDCFKAYCKEFGLIDWDIKYVMTKDMKPEASISMDPEGRTAYLELSSDLDHDGENINERLKYIACHEACHLLLIDFSHIAISKNLSRNMLDMAREALTMKLANLLKDAVHDFRE